MSSSRTEAGTPGTDQAGDTVAVTMPQMGISVSEGTILEWRKQVGESVQADETICDVTTDKVDVEIPCPASGVLERILVEAGETVSVGTPIAEVGSGRASNGAAADTPAPADSGAGDQDEPATPARAAGSEAPAAPSAAASDVPPEPAPAGERAGFVSPVVRRMAAEHGVDLSQVEGHGVGGRIRKKDLIAFIESGGATRPQPGEKRQRPMHIESPYRPEEPATMAAPGGNGHAPVTGERREEMSPMRRTIAEHMVRSRHTAAHCTTIVEVDFSAVASRRAALKESFARRGVPLTYLAFVARATVEALEEFPVLNSSVEGEEIVYHDSVNLGIAVAMEPGLIVPVIRDAQRLSLEGLAGAIADVAERARERKLEPDEVQGGTFTITNPGQFGAVLATPIINQPQVAILDLEAIVKRPVVVDDAIAIRPMAYLPMSWDHRALDGADAARFLGRIKQMLEDGAVR